MLYNHWKQNIHTHPIHPAFSSLTKHPALPISLPLLITILLSLPLPSLLPPPPSPRHAVKLTCSPERSSSSTAKLLGPDSSSCRPSCSPFDRSWACSSSWPSCSSVEGVRGGHRWGVSLERRYWWKTAWPQFLTVDCVDNILVSNSGCRCTVRVQTSTFDSFVMVLDKVVSGLAAEREFTQNNLSFKSPVSLFWIIYLPQCLVACLRCWSNLVVKPWRRCS